MSEPRIDIINGDCLAALEFIPSESVDCVVTSPPYWGLRSYGDYDAMIGLEPSLSEHMAALVAVFREIRRVLKKTGTLWVNYGDAYACAPNGRSAADTKAAGNDDRTFRDKPISTVGPVRRSFRRDGAEVVPSARDDYGTLKPKDRMLLPARFAIAMCDDGWWLRDEVIWMKPNPMPSSVKDRTTPAHEMIYMFSKAPRYFYDQEAIKEPGTVPAGTKGAKGSVERYNTPGVNSRPPEYKVYDGFRNKRSVWTVAPKPFKEAHFATFPPALIEPCILAGCPAEVCASCGAPWQRVIEKTVEFTSGSGKSGRQPEGKYAGTEQAVSGSYDIRMGPSVSTTTLGFKPTCKCDAPTIPGTVLDPFGGAGTTALVARRHGRNAILIELNADYCEIARRRLGMSTSAAPPITDKQGALNKRQYSGFNARWNAAKVSGMANDTTDKEGIFG